MESESSQLRVLTLINACAWGGGEALLVDRWRYTKNVAFELCTIYHGGRLKVEASKAGVPCYELNSRCSSGTGLGRVLEAAHAVSLPAYLPKLVRIIRDQQIRVVDAQGFPSSLIAAAASYFTPGVRYVYTHHFIRRQPEWILERRLFDWAFSRYARIIAVSEDIKVSLVRAFPRLSGHCVVVENGVDVEKFRPDDVARNRIRRSLEIAEDAIVLTSVARLVPFKNHDLMVRVMKSVVQASPSTMLLIVGEGPLRNSLTGMIKEFGLGNNVRLLGFRHDIGDILAASDIFVMPSVAEGLSVAALEACAAGVPLVASDGPGVRCSVVPGLNGIVLPAGDEAAWTKVLCELVRSPQRIRGYAEGARRVAVTKFDVRRAAEEYRSVFSG